MTDLELVRGEDGVATWAPKPSSGSSVRLAAVPFTYQDIAARKTPTLYTLAADDLLIFSGIRVTVGFNDSLVGGLFIGDASFNQWTGPVTGPSAQPPTDGLQNALTDDTVSDDYRNVVMPLTPPTVAKALCVCTVGWAGDGSAGSGLAYFFVATPTAA